MASTLENPPMLQTPDHDFLEAQEQGNDKQAQESRLDADELYRVYEIERTVRKIKKGKWKRIALQFPDEMLTDAARVYEALTRRLREHIGGIEAETEESRIEHEIQESGTVNGKHEDDKRDDVERLYILGDTSYGACCVDEVAAEHVDAEVVIHYGRACLSPTARLPVIYVFTDRRLPLDSVYQSFQDTFPDNAQKIILMTDVMYTKDVRQLAERLRQEGYSNLFAAEILRDPSSALPNRTVPDDVQHDHTQLGQYSLFHIHQPPPSLLLTIASSVGSIHILSEEDMKASNPSACLSISTASALRRRYGLVVSLSSASIFGILINTLSVKNYLHIVDHVKQQIEAAGKKSYTFVVGKVNAAKLANFSEVDGWVVIGCWESSLVENKDFWKPVLTPFELELALKPDDERVWTGKWSASFNELLFRHHHGDDQDDIIRESLDNSEGMDDKTKKMALNGNSNNLNSKDPSTLYYSTMKQEEEDSAIESEPESAPPEFDLRTGRYKSHPSSVPIRSSTPHHHPNSLLLPSPPPRDGSSSQALLPRSNNKNGLVRIGGQVSLGAQFLLSKRTWKGLGAI